MKQLVVLVGCAVFLSGFAGCQSAKRGVKVIVDGDGEFPEFLVGTWKADKGGWEFIFEPDGTISSAVIGLGKVRMKPGQIAEVPMQIGGKAVFEPGLWTVQYSVASGELSVEVVIDNFHMEERQQLLGGKATNMFVGPVSENDKIWQAEWFDFSDYIFYTPEPVKVAFDPNKAYVGTVIFKKFEE